MLGERPLVFKRGRTRGTLSEGKDLCMKLRAQTPPDHANGEQAARLRVFLIWTSAAKQEKRRGRKEGTKEIKNSETT